MEKRETKPVDRDLSLEEARRRAEHLKRWQAEIIREAMRKAGLSMTRKSS
jgi:hypothetical protein